MTPEARLASAIDLLNAIAAAPRRPADATANAFFRERRFIGGGDRRAIAQLAWNVLRNWRKLHWHFPDRAAEGFSTADVTPRLLCAAMLHFEGMALDDVARMFSGERYAPARLKAPEKLALSHLAGKKLAMPQQSNAVRLEYPDWLAPALEAQFGPDLVPEMAAMGQAPTLDLRANLLKGTREEALRELARAGLTAKPTTLSPWGLRLEGRQPVTASQPFRDGLVEIQDEGSQLVAAAAAPKPGQRVADFCAGAAGKTLAMAMLMENRGQIVACDVSEPRLEGAAKRLKRAGVHNATRHLLTAGDKWAKRREGTFDVVLVDAPCSGTGTWRRNPDARLRLRQQDLDELVPKQAAILQRAAKLVRPGGRLVYATCSLLDAENGQQVAAFLQSHPDFALAAEGETSSLLPEGLRGKGAFSLTPYRDGTDGFFAATMVRKAAPTSTEAPLAGPAEGSQALRAPDQPGEGAPASAA
ncbi:RsmB/NOP family class I SAM-dependent RNA methyltransferase [Formicincola oecophyllae]|uniref:RsmB/NOP family class I SAM-dependent RNA methyltransferase n=1 Tax=Formicincola oecophyllae TaxID=2558361 RepID=A0A4Y6UBY4_9PROT|nr:RsmB/NOP family class I SAM-dependent RNA methyltransferase [Formicincola oecophyllae]QDH13977.1 RsmB/NOP family class I SAM-dependent RNA methyltransferase [Formicincola oecophyllae]